MSNKKLVKLLPLLLILIISLAGCGDDSEVSESSMDYVAPEELKETMESGSEDYVILDVRQAEDYQKAHLEGAVEADVHAANKEGDDEKGKENLEDALLEATGSETGTSDDKYALVCYSGKSYAQKATDLLIEMGVSDDQIVTLEGGMEAWEEGGEEYTELVE